MCVCVRACVYDTGKGSQKIKTCHRKRGSGGVKYHTCAQSLSTLCGPTDCSPPHGIFQARILEWVAVLFSRRFS